MIREYDIDTTSDDFEDILAILETETIVEDVFSNAIKMEYQMNMYGIEKNIHSSMLFNMDEFLNLMRNGWQKIIDGESRMYEAYTPSIFKREYIYYALF
jgi:hypothetical protein